MEKKWEYSDVFADIIRAFHSASAQRFGKVKSEIRRRNSGNKYRRCPSKETVYLSVLILGIRSSFRRDPSENDTFSSIIHLDSNASHSTCWYSCPAHGASHRGFNRSKIDDHTIQTNAWRPNQRDLEVRTTYLREKYAVCWFLWFLSPRLEVLLVLVKALKSPLRLISWPKFIRQSGDGMPKQLMNEEGGWRFLPRIPTLRLVLVSARTSFRFYGSRFLLNISAVQR